jgi:GDPmannose 4,6-dehydratase
LKRALITGITGQDGFYLSKFLIEKNYRVFGLLHQPLESKLDEFRKLLPEVTLIHGDLRNLPSLIKALNISSPDELYNLGAVSFIGQSFNSPEVTSDVNALGPLRLLEAIRSINAEHSIKVYQASSSEMFGKAEHSPQNESSPFNPQSPYGVAKVFAHQICINYRDYYGMKTYCGILFSHESEHRGEQFVTRKITKGVAEIKKGRQKKIILGTLESRRDWGYAGDYVEAMWLMLQHELPGEYVIATGQSHSVREFLELALKVAELKGSPEEYVILDESFKRRIDVDPLVGDASKAKSILGWEPKVSFYELVTKMVRHDLNS